MKISRKGTFPVILMKIFRCDARNFKEATDFTVNRN